MSDFKGFEEIKAWKRSHALCIRIYKAIENSKEYGFRGHIFKTALSIPSNIAEGHERRSSREFIQFLNYAKGSCGELRSQLYVARDLELIEKGEAFDMEKEVREISSMISGLIKACKKRIAEKEKGC